MLWQNLFWFFGHPEVYILALPFFGIVTEVIAGLLPQADLRLPGHGLRDDLDRRAVDGVWAHHMFTTGVVLLPFFSLMSYLIAVPTGIKFFNWIGTMWRGSIKLRHADAVRDRLPRRLLVRRGDRHLPGLAADRLRHPRHLLRRRPLPRGASWLCVFGGFAGFYYWYPKMTGRMLREGLGKASFWFMFIGF